MPPPKRMNSCELNELKEEWKREELYEQIISKEARHDSEVDLPTKLSY